MDRLELIPSSPKFTIALSEGKITRYKKIIKDAWEYSETYFFVVTTLMINVYIVLSYESYKFESKSIHHKVSNPSYSPSEVLSSGIMAIALGVIVGLIKGILNNPNPNNIRK